MDLNKITQNHVSYVFSKNVILKGLLEKGVISDADFDRYDQILYDRYHMDAKLQIPRPVIQNATEDNYRSSSRTEIAGRISYVSLTAIAKEINKSSPGNVVLKWLRDHSVINFLRYWERKNNPVFNEDGYIRLMEELRSPSMTITVKKWIEATGAIGLQSKLGNKGGVSAHPEIACAFKAWLLPEFQYTLIQSYMSKESIQEDRP